MTKPKSELLVEIDKQIEDTLDVHHNVAFQYKKDGILAQMKDELRFLKSWTQHCGDCEICKGCDGHLKERISDLKHDLNLNGVGK